MPAARIAPVRRTNAKTEYQEKVDSELETLVLRLAGSMPDLVEELGRTRPNARLGVVEKWMRNYPLASAHVLDGLASWLADLRKLTMPSNVGVHGVTS